MDRSIRSLRSNIFAAKWPLNQQIAEIAASYASHSFLENPTSQNVYTYLTQFVKSLAEYHSGRPISNLSVLDWGCGKGHVSKLMRDLGPKNIESCDVISTKDDSAFGQGTPLIEAFGIRVRGLEHDYILPYDDEVFDVVLSVGVLEHVPNDRASLIEINRVLKRGGLFFCFFLPTNLAWSQKLAHLRGNFYHDRFYNEGLIREMIASSGFNLLDFWYRQIFPKNTVHYPFFRVFERIDQLITEHSPLRVFATNIEFVCEKS
jgi:SAM-dependent methyltransferase